MNKLKIVFNRYRKKFNIVFVILLIIAVIQIVNMVVKYQQKSVSKKDFKTNTQVTADNSSLATNQSAVTGQVLDTRTTKDKISVIDNFINYCIKQEYEEAYQLLTEECKENLYPTIQDFKKYYCDGLFDGTNQSFSTENFVGDIFTVKIQGDILATGKVENKNYQDYITTVYEDHQYLLNINSFIGRTTYNSKVTESQNVKVSILSLDQYMDYEIYTVEVENNTGKTILLDPEDGINNIYLLDRNEIKYTAYRNELLNEFLQVRNQLKTRFSIKMATSYNTTRSDKAIVFGKMILDYEEYQKLDDKTQYDYYQFQANI